MAALRFWLASVLSNAPAIPIGDDTAKAIRVDLKLAGVPYETEEGVADFHTLRAYGVTASIRSGASVSEVQKLARHARPETTLAHYAKVAPHGLRGVIEGLPTPTKDNTLETQQGRGQHA